MENTSPVDIAFICDDLFAAPTLAAIQSVKQSKSAGTRIRIHVVAPGLKAESQARFGQFDARDFSVDVRTVELGELSRMFRHASCPVTKTALLKFRLSEIFADLDRILYLDGDVLVRKDLSEMFSTDLGGAWAAAVKDCASGHMYPRERANRYMRQNPDYFNSGVMLLDLAALRANGVAEKLIGAKAVMSDSGFMDQDPLNITFARRVKLLPAQYNFTLTNLKRDEKLWSIDAFNSFYGTSYSSFDDAMNDAAVWHFSAKTKPWMSSEVFGAEEWLRVWESIADRPEKLNALNPAKVKHDVVCTARSAALSCGSAVLAGARGCRLFIGKTLRYFLAAEMPKISDMETMLNFHGVNKEKIAFEMQRATESGTAPATDGPGVVVSLTSYPGRIYDLHFTIHSLLSQTVRPEKVILWLGEEKFPQKENDLPDTLLKLKARGLEIRFTHDMRAFTKLIPALKEFPDKIIVTADDDIYYPSDWLERLVNSHKRSPRAIWTVRSRKMEFGSRGLKPYHNWDIAHAAAEPSFANFLTGVGGVLYPPGSLHPDVFNEAEFKLLTPKNDDIWFWAMAVRNGTKIGISEGANPYLIYVNLPREFGFTDDGSLLAENVLQNANDGQLLNVLARYPEINGALQESV